MIIRFSIGSKCAVMLPRKFINEQLTPAKGLILNRFLDSNSLVLIEEVWQFKGFPEKVLSEMCFPSGKLKQINWGWQEVPSLMKEEGDYLVVKAQPENLMELTTFSIEEMIKKSVADFKVINGFV